MATNSAENQRKRYHADIDQSRAKKRERYRSRLEHNRAKKRALHDSLTSAEKLEKTWRQAARPPTPTPGSKNSRDPRKTALARACMPWSDIEEVFRIYLSAAVMTELFGKPYVVDHLVPLQGLTVCGLHTHDNLAVVTADENYVKGRYLWPQMAAIDWGTMDLLTQYAQNS